MECGIVGLPGVGKTTLFNALSGLNIDSFAGGQKPNLGIADIPDPRLHIITRYIVAKKVIPATIKLVDIPGVPAGGGSEKLNAFLSHVRQVDAICHVVRCFESAGMEPAPASDIETLNTELVLADLVVAEGAVDRARKNARSGDKDAKDRLACLERICEILGETKPIRSVDDWTDQERGFLKSYGMITAKPVLYVANVGEDDLGSTSAAAEVVTAHAAEEGAGAVTVCAALEAELSELEDSDRDEMLESLGLSEPAIGPMARATNEVLGLTTFYTAGEKEVRAWAIPIGATAPEAAGAIHSDIQRGFIRAECYSVADLESHQTEKAIRDAGKLRSEGKGYTMQDGDVVHFLFNV